MHKFSIMNDSVKDREELIEMFGVHFENVHHLPPLGSRIFAILILDACARKVSFEDLIEMTGASKSSVSTNLNLLLKIGKITYFTQPGDRKKYYQPVQFSDRFDNYKKMIDFEKQILEKLLAYRKQTLSCSAEKLDLEKAEAYKEHLNDMENLLHKTISQFKELENTKQ